jgi:nucleoside-diphosphate-sugar epimerase
MCENNLLGAFNNNVRNFVNLLPKIEGKVFIYASSSSVYGNIDVKEATEECNAYQPNNFYDLNKSEIDNYAKLFNNIDFYGLRFGTVNGSSPNLRTDIMINAMVNTAKEKGIIKVNNPGISRPILYVFDLCRAIDAILYKNNSQPGIYNLASFNSTVDKIATEVASHLKIPIEYQELPAYVISKTKLQSRAYDFSISSKKFETNFNFKFCHGCLDIVEDLVINWDKIQKGTRNSAVHYI